MALKIKFSHDYTKLPEGWENTKATLIGLSPKTTLYWLQTNMPKFLDYDTTYRGEDGKYELNEDNDLFILSFLHETGTPFTTIRRYVESKYQYYQDNFMEEFTMTKTQKT